MGFGGATLHDVPQFERIGDPPHPQIGGLKQQAIQQQQQVRERMADQGRTKRVKFICESIFSSNQSHMARVLDVSQSQISRVVVGLQQPGVALFDAVGNLPEVNRSWLITGTGEPFNIGLHAVPVTDASVGEEVVNHPAHYLPGQFETYKVLEAWGIEDRYIWNAMKYLSRCGKKDDPRKEVGKAAWYLVRKLAADAGTTQSQFDAVTAAIDTMVESPTGVLDAGMADQMFGSEFDDLYRDLIEWSIETFGTYSERGPIGVLKHLEKEAVEAQENSEDPAEYADCLLLILDAAARAGIGPLTLIRTAQKKMHVNKCRDWSTPTGPDEAIEHIEPAKKEKVK